jgi:hypothetical protein
LLRKDYHKVLGLSPGATEKQIKSAYRKLALKYHPDRNKSPGAEQKFQEITTAYDYLLDHPEHAIDDAPSYEEHMAGEVYRRERERMEQQARARRAKKKKEEEYFNRPEWRDPILLLKYVARVFGLLFAIAAIVLPILLAIFGDPASLAGTAFFLIVGVFLLVIIYQQRSTWFRLGKFRTTWKEAMDFIRIKHGQVTNDWCCYTRNSKADGIAYKIELLKIMDIKVRSYGVLNHSAKYKNKVKRVVLPRSFRAQLFHRIASQLKVLSIIACLFFFPVESVLWRFMAGMLAGGMLSTILLGLVRVRSKVSYLLTPGLLIKAVIWVFVLYKVSEVGPGFNIIATGYVKIAVVGLIFFLDMLFDLVMGFFPFYHKLLRPLLPQGVILSTLYRAGYQNNMELPVYSVLFPFYKWLF